MRGLIADFLVVGIFCLGTAAFAADPEVSRASRHPRLGIVCLEPRSGRLDIHSERQGCNARSGERRVNAAQVSELVVGALGNQPGATGPQGVAGPQGPQGPVGPTAFPRLETYIFGVADSSNVIVDDHVFQPERSKLMLSQALGRVTQILSVLWCQHRQESTRRILRRRLDSRWEFRRQ